MIPSLWPNAPEISENKSSITINPGINNIDYPTAQILLDSGKVVLLDVRERDEYNLGYIIGAINFPVDAITKDSYILNCVALKLRHKHVFLKDSRE